MVRVPLAGGGHRHPGPTDRVCRGSQLRVRGVQICIISISTLYLCYLQGRVCPLQRVVLPRNRVPRAAQLRRHPLQPAAVPQLLAVGGAAVRGRGAAAARGRQSRAAMLGLVAGPVQPRRGLRGQPRPRPRLRGGQVAAGGGRGPRLLVTRSSRPALQQERCLPVARPWPTA